MNNYKPLPGDQLTRGGRIIEIQRVFPTQVVFTLDGSEYILNSDEFHTKAQAGFQQGAVLTRGGEQLWPEPQPAAPDEETPAKETPTKEPGLSGSHNTHARLSPSDSKRWSNCTASIAFQEANAHRIKPDTSRYADEGTEAHDWAAKVLLNQCAPADVPEPFTDPVGYYVDQCRALLPDAPTHKLKDILQDAELGLGVPASAMFVEEEVPLFYQPVQHGTADFLALKTEGSEVTHFYARDYKHGAGVLVSTEDNTQLAIYVYSAINALQGAYEFPDDCEVNMSVVQPRHREADTQTPWIIKLADLRTFCDGLTAKAEEAREAANLVRDKIGAPGTDVGCDQIIEAAPHAVFAPKEGDDGACRWCKCKAFCSKRHDANTEGLNIPSMTAGEMLAAMPELDKQEMKQEPEARLALRSEAVGSQGRIITDEYLVRLVANKKAIVSLLNDAEEYLEGRLLDGEEIPGVKLVDGREGNRAWVSEEQAEVFLRGQKLKQAERCDIRLKSPTQIEKLLAAKLKNNRTRGRFESLVTRSPGKKKIAVDTDPRDAVLPAVSAMPDMNIEEFEV